MFAEECLSAILQSLQNRQQNKSSELITLKLMVQKLLDTLLQIVKSPNGSFRLISVVLIASLENTLNTLTMRIPISLTLSDNQ